MAKQVWHHQQNGLKKSHSNNDEKMQTIITEYPQFFTATNLEWTRLLKPDKYPVKAGMCMLPEDYKYSTAKFYEKDIDDWGFISHYRD